MQFCGELFAFCIFANMANIHDSSMKGTMQKAKLFYFDKWIEEHELGIVKDAFIDNNMNTLKALDMDNDNFASLITDQRIRDHNTDLVSKIIKAMQLLKRLRLQGNLVEMSESEMEIMNQIKTFAQDVNDISEELKEIEGNYDDKKKENEEILNQYQLSCQAELDGMGDIIDLNINKLRGIITKKENLLKNKLNQYKQNVRNTKSDEDEMITELDTIIENIHNNIDKEKQYFEDAIISFEGVLQKYGGNHDEKEGENQNEREMESQKIGEDTKNYYDQQIQAIKINVEKIKEFLLRNPIQGTEDDMISAVVNDELCALISQHIDNYITLNSINTKSAGINIQY